MKKIILSLVMTLAITGIFSAPMVYAVGTPPAGNGFTGPLIVPCSGTAIAGTDKKECNWQDFIKQVQKIINFLFYISVILATIAFIWCGFLFLTAGGDSGKAGEAKTIFFKVVVGFIWIFAAWLIVHLITSSLGLKDDISILGQP